MSMPTPDAVGGRCPSLCEQLRQNPPGRILVRGVNWLGDAVMTTPALQRLRECYPGATITLVTPSKLADLWRGHPAINGVLAFDSHEGLLSIARRIRELQCALAVILPNSPRTALECWLGRVPLRVGHQRPWRNIFLTHAVPPRKGELPMRKRTPGEIESLCARLPDNEPARIPVEAHHINQYLNLMTALGADGTPCRPFLSVSTEEQSAFRQKHGIGPAQLLLGINAGAEYGPAKRWPLERFIAAAKAIHARTQCHWLVLGGPSDVELAETLVRGMREDGQGHGWITNVAGKTMLRELCAAVKCCSAVLTNDTGPMHVAAATGTPVVVPFGSTSMEMTCPGLPGDATHRLLSVHAPCSPCFQRVCPIDFRCMNGITVDQVVTAVLSLLEQMPSAQS